MYGHRYRRADSLCVLQDFIPFEAAAQKQAVWILFGQRPQRADVLWGEFPYVRPFIHPYVPPSKLLMSQFPIRLHGKLSKCKFPIE